MLKSAKGVLLVLFLYLGLVWTGSAYWYRDKPNAARSIVENGLWFTIVGLAALLVILLGSWLFGYWKAYRARASSRPKPLPVAGTKPQAAGHDDDEALKLLLEEASARLIASPAFAKHASTPHLVLSGMPLYLVVGSEGAGKTSVIANSGLNPELLSGQPHLEKSSPSPTGLANIWLAADALFIEIAGRHFAGDSRRWIELLRTLAAKPKLPLWRRLWKGDLPGLNLRGIIHCSELRFFLSKPGPEQIERQSQLAQERLRTIIKIFGKRLPVFTVFTKADQIPYFKDFFGRFSEREAEQILGCTLTLPESERESDQAAFATSESKRISKSFNALYTSLAERRLSVLFHEPISAKKSRIYEFPREFNRIRQSIVDFLVQTFRPSPLEPTPVNRGFYFSGTREVEPLPAALDATSRGFETVNIPFQQAMDATSLFKGNLADLMKGPDIDADLQVTRLRRGGFQTRWAFLAALFQDVICRDRSVDSFVPTAREGRLGSPRTIVPILVLSVSMILGLFWTISWWRNASLVQNVYEGTPTYSAARVATGQLPSLPELDSLQKLHERVETLGEYRKNSTFWSLWNLTMRFGLYQVDTLNVRVREAYFSRLETSLLDLTHANLTSFLRTLGKSGDPNESRIATDRLKAYMMTTSPGKCMPEPQVVINGLTAMLQNAGLSFNDPRFPLAVEQIRFYANELNSGIPVKLPADPEAQAHALQYVNSLSNEERLYRQLIDAVARENRGYVQFDPSNKHVLTSPSNQVSAAFTPQGWESFKTRLEKENLGSLVDPCLLGVNGNSSDADLSTKFSEDGRRRIQDMYAREYLAAWRDFLSHFGFASFASARDAVDKLEDLSGPSSSLLGLFKFVSDNTTFSRLEPDQGGQGIFTAPLKKLHLNDLVGSDPPKDVAFSLNGVESAFQPVHTVVPAMSEQWINEKNHGYVVALGKLHKAMEDIDQKSGNKQELVQAYSDGNAAAKEAEDEVKKLTLLFNPNPVGRMDERVTQLLKGPVDAWNRLGYSNIHPVDVDRSTITTKVRKMCDDFRQAVLNKFPFSQGAQDLSLKDFSDWFAPDSGSFWMQEQNLLGKLAIRNPSKSWGQNPAEEVKLSQDLLKFLNKAQDITNAFFSDVKSPGFMYTLRPRGADATQVIEFNIDGDDHSWDQNRTLQHDFVWTGKQSTAGSFGRTGGLGTLVPFTSGSGIWGVFKMFHDAQRTDNRFVWTKASGAGGGPLQSPVQLEFVSTPAGIVDIFDPAFFSGFQCPQTVVQ